MIAAFEKHEPKIARLFKERGDLSKLVAYSDILKLPFLYLLGRSDGTISLDGANVYPHQIEMCIHSHPKLLDSTKTFRIGAEYDKKKNINFNIRIELQKGVKPNAKLKQLYHNIILEKLQEINSDFKESYTNDESMINPQVHLYTHGHTVFERSTVKNKYIE